MNFFFWRNFGLKSSISSQIIIFTIFIPSSNSKYRDPQILFRFFFSKFGGSSTKWNKKIKSRNEFRSLPVYGTDLYGIQPQERFWSKKFRSTGNEIWFKLVYLPYILSKLLSITDLRTYTKMRFSPEYVLKNGEILFF